MKKNTEEILVASVRASRKGQIIAHTKDGKAMGGTGVDGRKRYQIYSDRSSKSWRCTCPAFRFGKGRPCKHLKAFWNGYLAAEDVILYPESHSFLADKVLGAYAA